MRQNAGSTDGSYRDVDNSIVSAYHRRRALPHPGLAGHPGPRVAGWRLQRAGEPGFAFSANADIGGAKSSRDS